MDREALGTGAAQAAAELRANLSAITAASQVLERSVKSEKERSYLASINQSIFRMLHLIGRLELAHCLTDEDEIRAKNAVYDLGPWLRELAARLGSVLAVNRIEFHAEHPECLLLYCDLPMLQQALLELVSAAAEGADRVVLTVAARGKEVSLVVRGNGPVRTAEALSALTDEKEGVLSGVVLARQAISLHGGSLAVEAPQEGGLVLAASLPIRERETALRLNSPDIGHTGGLDPVLVALSGQLPAAAFLPEELG